jgi:hypothetical protein
MAKANDFLLDDDGDLLITDGDFVVGESDTTHVEDLIDASPGEIREDPTKGVGIVRYQGSVGKEGEIKRRVRLNLAADGYRVDNVQITGGLELYIDGERI